MIEPPLILHQSTKCSDVRDALALQCAIALHLSRAETRVLRYLASQSDGFRPALQHIADEAGVSRRSVVNARERLYGRRIVKLDRGKLIVDWDRVRIFASLDPRMTRRKYNPRDYRELHRPLAGSRADGWNSRVDFLRLAPLGQVVSYLARLSRREYDCLCDETDPDEGTKKEVSYGCHGC